MRPAPPAARRSSANRSTPYCITGFQYVITSTGVWVCRVISATAVNVSRKRNPAASAVCVASWITVPSMTGSE